MSFRFFLLDFPLHRYTGGALSAVTECPLVPRALCGFDGPIRRENWIIAMASASGSADGPDLKNRLVASRFIGGLARSFVLSDGDFFVCDLVSLVGFVGCLLTERHGGAN